MRSLTRSRQRAVGLVVSGGSVEREGTVARREEARIKGIGTNKTQRIPLALNAADSVEIAVMNLNGEAVRLKLFEEGIPERFLEVQP